MKNENNIVRLNGIISDIKFSHQTRGTNIYSGIVSVTRVSGTVDMIPVNMRESILDLIHEGDEISANGEFRSRNRIIDGKSRLQLYVMITDLEDNPQNTNSVELIGYICKEPIHRETPLHREITDAIIAVNRAYGKSDYIPVIIWGMDAKVASTYIVGDMIKIRGRVQSRIYHKDNEERIAYELSAFSVSRISNTEIISE